MEEPKMKEREQLPAYIRMPRTFLLCCADIFNSSCCLQGCLVPRSSILPIYTLIQLSSVWLCVWLAVIVAGGQSAHVTVPRVALIWANTAQEPSDTQWSPSKVVCWLSCLAMNACDCCRVTNQWKQLGHGLFIFSLLLGLHPQQHSPRFCHREERTDLHLKHPSYRTLGAVVAAHDFTANLPYPESETSAPKGSAALRAPRQHVHAPGAGTAPEGRESTALCSAPPGAQRAVPVVHWVHVQGALFSPMVLRARRRLWVTGQHRTDLGM